MAPAAETAIGFLRGLYRLFDSGAGVWLVRAVLVSMVAMEPKDYAVCAVVLVGLGYVAFLLMRMAVDVLVAAVDMAISALLFDKRRA